MRNQKRFITSPKQQEIVNQDFVSIVLLAENSGHRMKSYGPMPLLSIGGKTVLEKQIDIIKSCFLDFEILLCCGFESLKIATYVKETFSNINIRIVENQIYNNSNSCESVRLCLNNTMNDKILIYNMDLMLDPIHLRKFDFSTSAVLTQANDNNNNMEIGVTHNFNTLENISIGIKSDRWTEVSFLSGKPIIESLQSILSCIEYKNKFIFEGLIELIKLHKLKTIDVSEVPIYKISNTKILKGINYR